MARTQGADRAAKLWLLWPPARAAYSATPALDFARALALNASLPRPLVCAQRVGDVVFVPAGWGHAVLNTREVAGLAVEFVYRYNRLV